MKATVIRGWELRASVVGHEVVSQTGPHRCKDDARRVTEVTE